MSQKNTLFNYFKKAKSSPASTEDKKTPSSEDKKTPSSAVKNASKGHTPAGKQQTHGTTPKRPRSKEAKGTGSEKRKDSGSKPYKRLRLISDDEDSENDQSLANGKAPDGSEGVKVRASESNDATTKAVDDHILSESDGPADDSEDEYKRKCAMTACTC